MVLLGGEAGIGKSRITEALVQELGEEPHIRLRYQCSPYHVDSALWPVIQQLGHAASFVTGEPPEARLDKLEVLLARGVDAPQEAAPLFAALLGIDAEGRYGRLDLTPQQRRSRTLQALIDQLMGLLDEAAPQEGPGKDKLREYGLGEEEIDFLIRQRPPCRTERHDLGPVRGVARGQARGARRRQGGASRSRCWSGTPGGCSGAAWRPTG